MALRLLAVARHMWVVCAGSLPGLADFRNSDRALEFAPRRVDVGVRKEVQLQLAACEDHSSAIAEHALKPEASAERLRHVEITRGQVRNRPIERIGTLRASTVPGDHSAGLIDAERCRRKVD